MKTLVLKVDVDTYRGTKEGVPRLVELFQKHQVGATFLMSLGPDHTGWALKRIFRPGFFQKVQRTSVLEHYGLKTLMYGVLWPAPHIGRSCATEMRAVRDAGFEVGIHSYDHVYWQDSVATKDRDWTEREMLKAAQTFEEIFGEPAQTHGAAGWQMNEHAYRWLERFKYASDGRGESPFYPVFFDTQMKCLQMPTTLPTMDELLGTFSSALGGVEVTPENIEKVLLSLTREEKEFGHVFTLHAELEGQKLRPAFERFIVGLKNQGYELLNMKDYFKRLDKSKVPAARVEYRSIAGRAGALCCQG